MTTDRSVVFLLTDRCNGFIARKESQTVVSYLSKMAVYVDELVDYGWRLGMSCHLIADTVAELKQFAVGMGLKLEWYQPKSSPHFDLTVGGRELAVEHGAIELDRRAFVAKMRELRALSWPE